LIPACASAAGKQTGAAKPVKYKVVNKSGSPLTVTLTGPAYYTITAKPGNTKVELQPGKYTYTYRSECAGFQSGTVEFKRSGDKLLIPGCGGGKAANSDKPGKTIKLLIENKTGGTLTLYLSGPASYTFTFGTGKTKVQVVRGDYSYTAYGCGTTQSGTVKVNAPYRWEWWCEQ
jgi:hypothetical protein